MSDLRSATIRLAHANPELREHLLPLLKTASVRKPLYGHTSPQTAYVVDDYPYGFKLRTKIRYWIESNPSKGYRFVSQTMDPKKPGEVWNKPKASTYSTIAGELYLDEKDHVQWSGITPYTDAPEVMTFLTDFPHADKTQLKRWIPMKIKLYEKLLAANAQGSSGFSINGEPQKADDADIGRNRQSLEDWTAALKKL